MKRGDTLRTDADFDNARLFGATVEVWQQGEILDYGGQIEQHDAEAVKINDVYYQKWSCTFKLR